MILCSLTLLLSACGGSDGDNRYTGVSMRQHNCAPASYLLEALETGRNYANNFAAAQYSLAIFLSWRIL